MTSVSLVSLNRCTARSEGELIPYRIAGAIGGLVLAIISGVGFTCAYALVRQGTLAANFSLIAGGGALGAACGVGFIGTLILLSRLIPVRVDSLKINGDAFPTLL